MSDESPPNESLQMQARAWAVRLARADVSDRDFQAFRTWLLDPANRQAWSDLDADRRRRERYVVRPAGRQFRVVDIWTGETAVIAMTPQDDLSEADASHTAELLNRRAAGGDRAVLQ